MHLTLLSLGELIHSKELMCRWARSFKDCAFSLHFENMFVYLQRQRHVTSKLADLGSNLPNLIFIRCCFSLGNPSAPSLSHCLDLRAWKGLDLQLHVSSYIVGLILLYNKPVKLVHDLHVHSLDQGATLSGSEHWKTNPHQDDDAAFAGRKLWELLVKAYAGKYLGQLNSVTTLFLPYSWTSRPT